mmetsp:Transcript_25744/g.60093  ORF Transcript_25744/g.60093 Transcript_25744/m.60093 type:complete len:215 (-) Transcript_25744:430-1074(-)
MCNLLLEPLDLRSKLRFSLQALPLKLLGFLLGTMQLHFQGFVLILQLHQLISKPCGSQSFTIVVVLELPELLLKLHNLLRLLVVRHPFHGLHTIFEQFLLVTDLGHFYLQLLVFGLQLCWVLTASWRSSLHSRLRHPYRLPVGIQQLLESLLNDKTHDCLLVFWPVHQRLIDIQLLFRALYVSFSQPWCQAIPHRHDLSEIIVRIGGQAFVGGL